MRKIVYILLLAISLTSFAGETDKKVEKARRVLVKKETTQAKTYIKSGNNLDKAEASMRKLLADTANMRNLTIHQLLIESLRKQYEQGNERLFLRQKQDTAQVFYTLRRLFLATNQADSIDILPDVNGKVSPRMRSFNANYLVRYNDNVYNGIIYFVNKQKWIDAISMAELYLSFAQWPLFSQSSLNVNEERQRHAAYLLLHSGYHSDNIPAALRHKDKALRYGPRRERTLQYLASIAEMNHNEQDYEYYIEIGADSFPTSSYFYPRLVHHYTNHNRAEKALKVVSRVLQHEPDNGVALAAKQTILLNLSRYDECISLGDSIVSRLDSLDFSDSESAIAEIYYNCGIAYYNQTIGLDETIPNIKMRTAAINELYKKCRPYMEEFRRRAPEEKKRWKPVLYNIYLNLNLGKEFTEIETL